MRKRQKCKKPVENRLKYRKNVKNVLNGEKTRQKCGKKSQNIEKPGENHQKYLKNFKNVEKLEKNRQK